MERVDVRISDVAYNMIGGGDEGEKASGSTKEEDAQANERLMKFGFVTRPH